MNGYLPPEVFLKQPTFFSFEKTIFFFSDCCHLLPLVVYKKNWLSITTFSFQGSDKYIISSDTRAQLRFLEKLDHLEKQRKDEEEREMLLRAAKVRTPFPAFQGGSVVLQIGEHL